MKHPIRLDYVLVCDDIRLEIGQKPSAMGIFTDGVLVPTLPFVFPKLCFLVHAILLASIESMKISATFQYADQPPVVLAKDQELKVKKTPNIPGGIILTFVVAPFSVPDAGEGVLTLELASKRYRKTFSVLKGTAPSFIQ